MTSAISGRSTADSPVRCATATPPSGVRCCWLRPILREMRALDQFGLLIDVDGIARVPAGLRPAVVASITGPGAPLAVVHDTLAVPVVTDE